MRKNYLVFSAGPHCRPAYYLRKFEIREKAFPLDWQICSLENTLLLYKTGFKDFFNEYKEYPKYENKQKCLRYVKDTKYSVISMHHIRSDIPLKDAVKEFKKTMKKRYRNLDSEIKKVNKVIMLSSHNVSFHKLTHFLKSFAKIYTNKEIVMINIHSRKNGKRMHSHTINSKIKLIEFFFNDVNKGGSSPTNKEFWHGNVICSGKGSVS